MTEPMKTALASLQSRPASRPKATAAEIDRSSGMPSREAPTTRSGRRKVKTKAQIGVSGDADIIQRFVDYADTQGLQYAEAIESLMDRAGIE